MCRRAKQSQHSSLKKRDSTPSFVAGDVVRKRQVPKLISGDTVGQIWIIASFQTRVTNPFVEVLPPDSFLSIGENRDLDEDACPSSE